MHDPAQEDPFISMDEPRKRLSELDKHLADDLNGLVHEFGRFLAGYVGQGRVSPIGFVIDCEYALHDIQTGLNRRTRKAMQNRLTGQLPLTYKSLHAKVPQIAEAIFPAEFAAKVRKVFENWNPGAKDAGSTATAATG